MNAFGSAHNPHEDDTQAYDVELARRVSKLVEEALDDPAMLADLAQDVEVAKAMAKFIFDVRVLTPSSSYRQLRRDLARAVTDRVAEEMMDEGKR